MKWRDIRDVLRGAVVQAVARILVGLLAAIGAVDVATPDDGIAAPVAQAVRSASK